MKYTLSILFILIFNSAFCQQNLPDSGFTNRAEAKNRMVNGKKEGKWVEYRNLFTDKISSDSNLAEEYTLVTYHLGKRTGIARLCAINGHVWSETAYSDGKKNGIEKEYGLNGVLEGETFYKHGKKSGIKREYYSDSGRLQSETFYINGVENGNRKYYYENGNLKDEVQVVNGKRSGTERSYYDNGKIESETPLTEDSKNGIETIYDKNGQILAENHYMNGAPDGIIKSYNDGILQSETPFTKGKENGLGKTYYTNGVLESETPFVNGKINGVDKEYYENGNLKDEFPRTYNLNNGIAKEYYEDGKLKTESSFNNDTLNGLVKNYYENGEIMSQTQYRRGIETKVSYFSNKGNEITLEQVKAIATSFNWTDTLIKSNTKRAIKIMYDCDGPCDVNPCYESRGNHFVYDTLIDFLKQHPSTEIEIASYYNGWHKTRMDGVLLDDDWSQKKADYMKQVLVDKGIAWDRILPVGYGSRNPILSEKEIKKLSRKEQSIARYHNIRIEIIIIENGS